MKSGKFSGMDVDTKVRRLIESNDWASLLQHLETKQGQEESRRGFPIRRLFYPENFNETNPPPINILQSLLQSHPEALSIEKRRRYGSVHMAIEVGASLNLIQIIVDADPETCLLFHEADTPASSVHTFFVAIQHRRADVLQFLLELIDNNVYPPHTTDKKRLLGGNEDGLCPLYEACRSGLPTSVIGKLLRVYPEACKLKETSTNRFTLHTACEKRIDTKTIKEIVQTFPDAVMSPDASGYLPLHISCMSLDLETVDALLLSNPEAVNQPDSKGILPFQYFFSYIFVKNADELEILVIGQSEAEKIERVDRAIGALHVPPSQDVIQRIWNKTSYDLLFKTCVSRGFTKDVDLSYLETNFWQMICIVSRYFHPGHFEIMLFVLVIAWKKSRRARGSDLRIYKKADGAHGPQRSALFHFEHWQDLVAFEWTDSQGNTLLHYLASAPFPSIVQNEGAKHATKEPKRYVWEPNSSSAVSWLAVFDSVFDNVHKMFVQQCAQATNAKGELPFHLLLKSIPSEHAVSERSIIAHDLLLLLSACPEAAATSDPRSHNFVPFLIAATDGTISFWNDTFQVEVIFFLLQRFVALRDLQSLQTNC